MGGYHCKVPFPGFAAVRSSICTCGRVLPVLVVYTTGLFSRAHIASILFLFLPTNAHSSILGSYVVSSLGISLDWMDALLCSLVMLLVPVSFSCFSCWLICPPPLSFPSAFRDLFCALSVWVKLISLLDLVYQLVPIFPSLVLLVPSLEQLFYPVAGSWGLSV